MFRRIAIGCALLALVFCAGSVPAQDKAAKAAKNQMVKGTVKSADIATAVLVVSQKVKDEKVDRELTITDNVEFSITVDGTAKSYFGKEGLAQLVGREGASVQVKCDKDVNVLKVTVTVKK